MQKIELYLIGGVNMHKKTIAIILAAGIGRRMNSDVAKQYLTLGGKPILYYTIKAFEESSVDEIILVVGKQDSEYCKKAILDKYQFNKVQKIIEGGKERYHSVYNGLRAVNSADYVLIHDGVRPFISREIIENTIDQLPLYNACVVGVPIKDTVKLVNEAGVVIETPNRDLVWSIQTPQAFSYEIIMKAYCMIMGESAYNSGQEEVVPINADAINENKGKDKKNSLNITDDAMIVEHTLKQPIKMIMGNYRNIKITTPEDLIIGEAFLKYS